MKPWRTVARAKSPAGGELVLQARDGEWAIRIAGHALMSSRQHGSEEALAEALPEGSNGTVLLGGLGLGYSLRAALNRLGPTARVVVAELFDAVVTWNRGPLADLSAHALEDPRVEVRIEDVRQTLAAARASLDAILLDVDNGPSALAAKGNAALYSSPGLEVARGALRRGGQLVVWSAGPDASFLRRLVDAGFRAEARAVAARRGPRRGVQHTLFVAKAR